MKAKANALRKFKKGFDKVGKYLDRKLIEPSRNVRRIREEKMKEMSEKAKRGEFNY